MTTALAPQLESDQVRGRDPARRGLCAGPNDPESSLRQTAFLLAGRITTAGGVRV
jgi:hypothetical protein